MVETSATSELPLDLYRLKVGHLLGSLYHWVSMQSCYNVSNFLVLFLPAL